MPPIPSPTLERLEARLDYQAARIDALYGMLEELRVLLRPADAGGARDAFFDELVQIEDAPLAHEKAVRPSRRPPARMHVGSATGV